MQLAVCATEGRARMLAKGATAATPPGLLWRKVLSVSPSPSAKQRGWNGEGTPSGKGFEWQGREDSLTRSLANPDLPISAELSGE